MSDISVKICDVIKQSVNEAFSLEVEDQMVMVERPRDPKMGDYSTNIAMRLAKSLHKKPVDIANELIEVLKKNLTEASEVSVAGPGFINFKINTFQQILQVIYIAVMHVVLHGEMLYAEF